MNKPIVLLTGGGTAGHVSVNEALIPVFDELGYEIHYIGSKDGIEKEVIQGRHQQVIYHEIQSGKLRRYFSLKNFTDPFRVGIGLLQALVIIRKLKPELIFSKGGFVSVPVAFAGRLTKTPVVIHESDVTPGLANKLALPFSNHIFTVFEKTLQYVAQEKATCSGAIIRPELYRGNRKRGLTITGLTGTKPVLFVTGGSQGAANINEKIRIELDALVTTYDIIHLVGKGNIDSSLLERVGYVQFDYVTDELPHLLAAADVVISRAGSNAIFEFLALKKPMLLVPLSAAQSRGDQLLNAAYFNSLGIASVLQEEQLTTSTFTTELEKIKQQREVIMSKMDAIAQPKTPEEMVHLILAKK